MSSEITKLIIISISAAFVNNVILSQFLGLCPFLGVSKKIKTASAIRYMPWCTD